MIFRNALCCDTCGCITLLRISVGGREKDAFRYECERCFQEVTGLLTTDLSAGALIDFSVRGARQVAETLDTQFDFWYHHCSSLPTLSAPNARELGISPDLAARRQLGFDTAAERLEAAGTLLSVARESGTTLRQIARQYFAGNWQQFQLSAGRFMSDPLEMPQDRQRALFRLWDGFFAPLFLSEESSAFTLDMMRAIKGQSQVDRAALTGFLDEVVAAGHLPDSQRHLFLQFSRFTEVAEEFRPVLIFWDRAASEQEFPEGWTVTAPRSFDNTKSLYIDLFETVSQSLTLVVGFINLRLRGHHNRFAEHPVLGSRYAPKSLAEFARMSNAPKLAYIGEWSDLERWIVPGMHPRIRDACAHSATRYDTATGNIQYRFSASGSVRSISYGEFLFTTLHALRAATTLAHFTKQLYLFRHFPDW